MHLEIRDLSWSVADKAVLQQINLQINQGQFVGLIGQNGSGKSSLLRCVYRQHRPSHGQVLLAGQDVHQLSAKAFARQVAVVLQEFPAEFGFTVEEVVRMGLTAHVSLLSGFRRYRQQVEQVLATVGLLGLRAANFDRLSGGEKQRCLLARALIQQPKLLILDEPTNHLDIHYQFQLLDLIKSLGITVLCSLHDLNIAARYCDHIYLLNDGVIQQHGSPAQVLTEQHLAEQFLMRAHVDQQVHHAIPRINYLSVISSPNTPLNNAFN